jgi:hypothetical protein
VVLAVLVLRNEVPKDHQNAVVRLTLLLHLRVLVLVELAHSGDGEQGEDEPQLLVDAFELATQ